VKADKDVIVLRTFSKIYGMAGLRCGVAIARPDLVQRG
jgi:histidinol-phosphate aminotransferase